MTNHQKNKTRKLKANYMIAKEMVLEMMVRDNYEEGDALPPLNKLCQIFDIGRISIYQALTILAQEGYLQNIRGSGCYVKKLPQVKEEKFEMRKSPVQNAPLDVFDSPNYFSGKKKIVFGIVSEYSEFHNLWEDAVKGFLKANPSITIEFTPINPTELEKKQYLADMVQIPASYFHYFIDNNFLFNPEKIKPLAIDERDFYAGTIEACRHQDILWGVPLITGITTHYYIERNRAYLEKLKFDDFDSYLKSLVTLLPFPAGTEHPESLVCSNHSVFIFLLLAGLITSRDFLSIARLENPDHLNFLENFAVYYQNPDIFLDCRSGDFSLMNLFRDGKTAILQSSSCWLPELLKRLPKQLHICPVPAAATGRIHGGCNVNAVSAYTSYPEECLDLLNYLAGDEAQEYFAGHGRITAHRRANQSLDIPGLAPSDLDILRENLEKSIIFNFYYPSGSGEFIHSVVANEMLDWKRKLTSTPMFLDRLKQKAEYYFNGLIMRQHLNQPDSNQTDTSLFRQKVNFG